MFITKNHCVLAVPAGQVRVVHTLGRIVPQHQHRIMGFFTTCNPVATSPAGPYPTHLQTCFSLATFPEDPCMVYLPTFTIKINQM